MNDVYAKIESKRNIETINLDYDIDEEQIKKYNIKEVLPVFIFLDKNDCEIKRLEGEIKENQFLKIIDELGEV